MSWLTTLAGETRTRLLQLVRGGARSVAELSDRLGITTNAVRTHLASLERDGLVRSAGVARSTGGKPARLYELAPAAEELFPKAYALVFNELLAALKEEEGEEAAVALLRRVGRRLGSGAVSDSAGGPARVAAAAALLQSVGGAVQVRDREDGWSIESDGCPLSGVVAETPQVCALAESLVGEVTGRRVVECCDRSERPRCSFRIFEEPAA